ncbi:MAG TPA: hypothetical protein VIJ93_01135 [bacterium]
MGNKQFALIIFLTLAAFFGWMAYDSQQTSREVRTQQASGDVLLGVSPEAMAPIQYLFHLPEPVYSHALNTQQIEQLGSATGTGEGEHYHVYGITVADYKMDALYQFNWSKKWFKEEYGMWIENLQVDFSYNTLNVYVTSNYPEDSCEYRETLAHENQHVEIHRRIYIEYQKTLRNVLTHSTGIPMADHPLAFSSKEEGKERIGKIIADVVDPVFDQFKQGMADEQAKIDTPENYAELRSRCQHW